MSEEDKTGVELEPFPEGAITERLARLSAECGVDDRLTPFRAAAAVLASFDPDSLQPFGPAEDGVSGRDLLPELLSVPAPGDPERLLWSLRPADRRQELERLSSSHQLEAALNANPNQPDSDVQRMIEAAVAGKQFELERLKPSELRALLPVAEWLGGIVRDLPEPSAITRRIESLRDEEALAYLADQHFTGRAHELSRLTEHLQSTKPRLLLVHGTGGAGKSALLARCMQQWIDSQPGKSLWVNLDIDHPAINPHNPYTFLSAALRHLSRLQAPGGTRISRLSKRLASRSANLDAISLEQALPESGILSEFTALVDVFGSNSFRLPFLVDTFEEAQFFGQETERILLLFLSELVKREARIRVIIAGRVRQRVADDGILEIERISLGDLPVGDAVVLLSRLFKVSGSADLEGPTITKAAERLGGNPLTLRLAAPLLAREGSNVLRDLALLGDVRGKALQRQLYNRILGHIRSPVGKKLAVPGLVVRKLTPGVVIHVLARPCGLGEIDLPQAEQILSELAREVALVSQEADGSLLHRQDVRRIMLEAMPSEFAAVIPEIDNRAAQYWTDQVGAAARAEEVYHRLRLGQSSDVLDGRWEPGAAIHLRGALEDFAEDSTQHAWLSKKLGVTVADRSMLSQEDWEEHAFRAANQYITAGNPSKALDVLHERVERRTFSALVALEARAYLLNKSPADAGRVLWVALETVETEPHRHEPLNAVTLVNWRLLLAYVAERQRNYAEAWATLSVALSEANFSRDKMLTLNLLTRRSRLRRKMGGEPEAEIINDAIEIASSSGPQELATRPAVLRETAAEFGEHEPKLLHLALSSLGTEVFETCTSAQLISLIEASGYFGPGEIEKLEHVPRGEIVDITRKVVPEALYSGSSRLTPRVIELFRTAVDANLSEEFGAGDDPAEGEDDDTFSRELRALDPEEQHDVVRAMLDQLSDRDRRFVARYILSDESGLLYFKDPMRAAEVVQRAKEMKALPALVRGLMQNVGWHVNSVSELVENARSWLGRHDK